MGYACVQGLCARDATDAAHADAAVLDRVSQDAALLDGAAADLGELPGDSAHGDTALPVDAAAATDASTFFDASPQTDRAPADDGASPTDAATAFDAVSQADVVAADDVSSPPDVVEPLDSGVSLDAATAVDRFSLDRSFNRDGWITITDGPIVILDGTYTIALVRNHSFEQSASDPLYWTPFGNPCTPSIHTFTPDSNLQPVQGTRAYGCITTSTGMSGGLLQQVSGLRENSAYVLGVSAYLVSECPSTTIQARLGVDPEGHLDPHAASVRWSTWAGEDARWQPLSLAFTSQASSCTVFLEYSLQSAGYNCDGATETALFDLVTLFPN